MVDTWSGPCGLQVAWHFRGQSSKNPPWSFPGRNTKEGTNLIGQGRMILKADVMTGKVFTEIARLSLGQLRAHRRMTVPFVPVPVSVASSVNACIC